MSIERTVRFGVISDAHVAPVGSPPYRWHDAYRLDDSLDRFARAVAACVALGAAALLIPGDVTHEGDPWALEAVIATLAATGLPAWIAGGNHDTRSGSDRLPEALARAAGTSVRGVAPAGERFGGLVIAGAHAQPSPEGRYRSERPQLETAPAPRLWLTHFPVLPSADRLAARGVKHAGDAVDRAEVAAALGALPGPTLVVAGHLHVRDAIVEGSTLQVAAAALVEPPFEVSLVEVHHDGDAPVVEVRCHAVDRSVSASTALPVLVADRSTWRHAPGQGWIAAQATD